MAMRVRTFRAIRLINNNYKNIEEVINMVTHLQEDKGKWPQKWSISYL